MRTFDFSFRTELAFERPVEQHDFVLRCVPPSTPRQRVRCTMQLEPDVPFDMQADGFGNPLAVGCVREPHSSFSYEVRGTAAISLDGCKPCAAHPLLRYSSPLTAMSEEMLEFLAQAASESTRYRITHSRGAQPSMLLTCQHLMQRLGEEMAYEPGSTTVRTTAQEAFAQRKGVCQDYAHILIAFFRELGIPARYASGLTLGEGATHAWAEAHIGGLWVGFDPTRGCMVDESYLALATGRDWADCPIERATFQGFTAQTQTVFAQMEEVAQ